MCGPDRPAQNGAVVIIHHAEPSQNIQLLLHNPTHSNAANTVMSYELRGGHQGHDQLKQDFVLRIHHHGDLTVREEDAAHVPFAVNTVRRKAGNEVELDRRLDLVVGGQGVIGRMMSVFSGREKIGDGVIGWN